MIRVLIIGLGSIGQRHAKALINIGVEKIAALRSGKGKKYIDKDLETKIDFFEKETNAFLWKPTHILISNPTSLHLIFVKKAIKNNIPFFVEKPITSSFDEIKLALKKSKISGVVGYNLRFHGLIQFVKKIILDKKYGSVITAQLHVGQYLPSWHPYENYREAYYSKKELGGGALRTLSHEIDLIQFFFGKVQTVFAKVQKLSELEINVDDVSNILAQTELCKQVSVHINYLDPTIKRTGIIYFTQGVLQYDFVKSQVIFTYNDGEQDSIYSYKEDINTQYESQMKDFLSNKKSHYTCTFEEGVEVLKIIEKCIESELKKREICLA